MPEQSPAMDLIRAERQRQIDIEGWTPDHDDQHDDGQLMRAAMCYYMHGTGRAAYRNTSSLVSTDTCPHCGNGLRHRRINASLPMGWPWEPRWWKPQNTNRDLVRSGALLLAEKDRLARRGLTSVHVDHKLELVEAALSTEIANA